MDNKRIFKESQFGMMIHWGLYSLYAGEYKGERQPKQNVSEWIQKNYAIPNAEYEKLADAFNPLYFDADEWVTLAKNAGMKYMVFTAKHHDGFSLFHSKVDPYNIVDATPFKRDVVKELADACKKQGIKFGVYYSQDMDWHEPNGGGYKKTGSDCRERSNSWDYPDADKKDYSICFEKKIKPQVEELLTNYGDIFLIWFDMPSSITPEQSEELYNLVKKHQPNCLINSRIGNGKGDYRSLDDNEISNEYFGDELVETPVTLNDTWGYKSYDNNWKSAEKIIELKKHLKEHGINFLLNVGPDYLGRFPAATVDILKELANSEK